MMDIIEDVARAGIDRATAVAGARALSRWYGGQQVYIPKYKADGVAREMQGVLADAIGDADAERVLEVLMRLYGFAQWYIPLELRAFRRCIAREIFEAYDGSTESMRELCRRYNTTFAQIYKLYAEGRAERQHRSLFDVGSNGD